MKKNIFLLISVFMLLGCTTTYKIDVYKTENTEVFYDRGISFSTLESENFNFQLTGEYDYDDDMIRFYLNIFNNTDQSINFMENSIKVYYSNSEFTSATWNELNYILPSSYQKKQSVIKKANIILDVVSLGYSFTDDNSSFKINTFGGIPEIDKGINGNNLLLTSTIKPRSAYGGFFLVNNNFKNGKRISDLGNIYIKVELNLNNEIYDFYFTLSKIEE